MRALILIASLVMAPLYSAPLLANQEATSTSEQDVLKLDWLDLIPEQERKLFDQQGMPMPDHNATEPAKQQQLGTVRTELNGSRVKIPGFVIPLEGDDQKVTEFLLVPYFGACIHVPPPPPNQIIY
ncbi:MAG: DUF3299 domain-containing protein, partial [Vibrio sp.]